MKHFTNLILILLSSLSTTLSAQKILWERSYGGSGREDAASLEQTSDGGYFLAGSTYSDDEDVSGNYGESDYWVLKLDSTGEIQWENHFGGSDSDFATSAIQTADGGYMVAGGARSDNWDVLDNYGSRDAWLIKLDSSGSEIGNKNYGGSRVDLAKAIQQTRDGGYIVASYSRSQDLDVSGNLGGSDYWIVKLSSGGEIEWEENYGGSDSDIPVSIEQTNDGGYVIAGNTSSEDGNVSVNNGYSDFWVLKIDPEGNELWEKTYGGSSTDVARSMQHTSDGGYILTGYSYSDDGDVTGNYGASDYWVLKLDPEGQIEWEKNYGGSSHDFPGTVHQTSDGGYLVAGDSESEDGDVSGNYGARDIWIIKTDSLGNLLWEQNYGGSYRDRLADVKQLSNGTYAILGYIPSDDYDTYENPDDTDFWLMNICNQTRSEIDVVFCGNYTVPSGDETYTSPGTYMDTIPNHMGCDSIITIHLTNEGYVDTEVYVEEKILQAAQFEAFYQWGRCTENGFEPIAGATGQTYTATESGDYAVVVMLDGCSDTSQCHTVNLTTGIKETAPLPHVYIYPNPADDELTVYLGEEYQNTGIFISNLFGQEVLHHEVNDPRPEVILPLNIPAGYYIVTIRQDGVKRSFKFQNITDGPR